MSNQEGQDQEYESQRPQEDVAKNPGDDEAAEGSEEKALDLEADVQWRIAKSLEVLRGQLNQMFPNRSKASDGGIGDAAHASRNSDHNPWVDLKNNRGVVTARDFTHDPANGLDSGAIADRLRNSHDPRIKYIISNRRIASSTSVDGQPPWTWRPYTGKNAHNHHFHISVLPDRTKYDDETLWNF